MIDDLLGLIGLSRKPDLPPVTAFTDADLERLHFAAMQSGDKERAGRIQVVKKMREQEQPLLTEAMRSASQPQPHAQSLGKRWNPLSPLNDVLRQQQ